MIPNDIVVIIADHLEMREYLALHSACWRFRKLLAVILVPTRVRESDLGIVMRYLGSTDCMMCKDRLDLVDTYKCECGFIICRGCCYELGMICKCKRGCCPNHSYKCDMCEHTVCGRCVDLGTCDICGEKKTYCNRSGCSGRATCLECKKSMCKKCWHDHSAKHGSGILINCMRCSRETLGIQCSECHFEYCKNCSINQRGKPICVNCKD